MRDQIPPGLAANRSAGERLTDRLLQLESGIGDCTANPRRRGRAGLCRESGRRRRGGAEWSGDLAPGTRCCPVYYMSDRASFPCRGGLPRTALDPQFPGPWQQPVPVSGADLARGRTFPSLRPPRSESVQYVPQQAVQLPANPGLSYLPLGRSAGLVRGLASLPQFETYGRGDHFAPYKLLSDEQLCRGKSENDNRWLRLKVAAIMGAGSHQFCAHLETL
ncbi:uncharacterized protein [Heterodontus francisci]|uniref:uncharacterized protein n=1 Tax=Heterodontus francisci TaxID=7792 RepID=UPI00355B0EE0